MKSEKFDSIFDNINDLEFEEMLKECGFDYKKVEPGKGGLYINGVKASIDAFSSNLYEKKYSKNSEYFIEDLIVDDTEFEIDNTNFGEAA